MIIARSPLRISLGGGGTDLPSYYRNFGGFLLAAAIDKYVYITIHKTFVKDFILKYSRLERVKNFEDIQHPIVKEALRIMSFDGSYLEISSAADIPAKTGLGSSGSFTTALLKALFHFKREPVSPKQLAEIACNIEINLLKQPIGKQDQYISSFGGICSFSFNQDDSVVVSPLLFGEDIIHNLEDNLLLFFTGYSRYASSVLREQNDLTINNNDNMLNNLHYIKELGHKSLEALKEGDLHRFGLIMHEHWEFKKKRSCSMSNSAVDECYKIAINNGAVGGKLVGAGGGGFLMFYTEDRIKLRKAMNKLGMKEVRFRFDFEGSKIIVS